MHSLCGADTFLGHGHQVSLSLTDTAHRDVALIQRLHFGKVLRAKAIESVEQHELQVHVNVALQVDVLLEEHQESVHQQATFAFVEVGPKGVEGGANQAHSEAIIWVV